MQNTDTLDPQKVHADVKRKGARFATVVFRKRSGEIRRINGLFRATSHMVGGDRGDAQHETLRNNDLVAIYSLKDRGWRSFKADRVLEVK